MRIALLSFKALPIYAIQLANGLSGRVDLDLHISEQALRPYRDSMDPRIRLFPFPLRRYRDPRSILTCVRLIQSMKKREVDLVHLVISEPSFNLCLPFIRSFPVVTTVHDVRYHMGDRRSMKVPQFISDLSVSYSEGLIVHGRESKRQICEKFSIPPWKVISIIPHGNYSFYRKWELPGLEEEENRILFFGSIWEYKGLRYLMEAEPLLRKRLKNFKIVVAGTGDDFEKYHRYVKDWTSYEILNRYIGDEEVAPLFQRASLVVLPYIDASQSGVAPLAFSFGKPVVATKVGDISELVDQGVNGLLVAPKDPWGLAEAILSILENPFLRRRMAEKAREKSITTLSWERIGEMHLEAYKEVIKKNVT